MSSKKISQLPYGGQLLVNDEFVIARSNQNFKLTGQDIADLAESNLDELTETVNELAEVVNIINNTYVNKDGSTVFTGNILLGGNTITNVNDTGDVATKTWVNNNFLPLSGGIMSGYVQLFADPIAPLQAATKQYVDTQLALLGNIPNSTNDLPEGNDGSATGVGTEVDGNRYYYTNQRFDDRLATKNSDDISEGLTNFYLTSSRFTTFFNAKDTDDLTEGSVNLYYLDSRARAALSADVGSAITYNSTTGVIGLDTNLLPGSSLGTSTQIPYINATNNDFLYSPDLTFDGTNLQVGGVNVITGSGTLNKIAKFGSNNSIEDSLIEEVN